MLNVSAVAVELRDPVLAILRNSLMKQKLQNNAAREELYLKFRSPPFCNFVDTNTRSEKI